MDPQTLDERNSKESVAIFKNCHSLSYRNIGTHCKSLALAFRLLLVAQRVKHLPTMQETQVQSLGLKDPLEKGMATHSSIFAWRIPWTNDPGWTIVHGVSKSWI